MTLLPAWALLSPASVLGLLSQGREMPRAISVSSTLTATEVMGGPLLGATRLLIERAITNDGLTLTAGGALSRADTRALFEALSWPGYDKAQVLAMNKVLNEADVWPVEVTRLLAQTIRFLRRRERRLLATKAARARLPAEASASLFRLLFEAVFWRLNLASLDRISVEHWPQDHLGVVLWSLSVSAQDWSTAASMVPVCTISDDALDRVPADLIAWMFESRVLQPLTWLGLMEDRLVGEEGQPEWRKQRQYRKTALFDRALTFDVEVVRFGGFSH
ncbi:hypothetical protein [Methylobacterium oryzisoli]|uniref:hypothetical protein n=1 Tax=Methylobacterium oryzisoli TaxID=3385502 RepID=UPI00389168E4